MKFAVVEYTSKSGAVWRHTPARPNYLADPIREIDPTSFGCYVSALQGEHIPLLGLIVGPVVPVTAATKWYRRVAKRLTGNWPTYSLDYLRQFNALLVVHQLSNAHELTRMLQRLRQQPSRPFIIGVPTQPYGILKDAVDATPQAKEEFSQFAELCDVFLTIAKATQPWYQTLTQTPAVYVPQPYPAHYALRKFVPYAQKQNQILVAGVTQRDNIKKGQHVAQLLQQQFPEYEIVLPKVSDLTYDTTALGTARYSFLPFEEWQQHLVSLGHVKIVINTDYTHTRGRVQVDCAAVGTPAVGSNSDAQLDLFPTLRSEPTTTPEKLAELAAKVLTDKDFYQSTVAVARERLRKYEYEPSAQRLRDVIATYKNHAHS